MAQTELVTVAPHRKMKKTAGRGGAFHAVFGHLNTSYLNKSQIASKGQPAMSLCPCVSTKDRGEPHLSSGSMATVSLRERWREAPQGKPGLSAPLLQMRSKPEQEPPHITALQTGPRQTEVPRPGEPRKPPSTLGPQHVPLPAGS